MKNRIFISLIIILFIKSTIAAFAQTTDGFKGFRWGTDFSLMKNKLGLILKETSGNSKLYTSNVTSIGEVKLTYCIFTFYKNKFSVVLMVTEGFWNIRNLLDILKEKYGDDYDEFELLDTYLWHLDGTTVGYIRDKTKKVATTYIRSDSLYQEIQNDKKKKAKEGAKDF
ncbi:MAG: hypothetical protein HY707_02095 [Ignavibacteriae bacterium]|nr:hypothetical protein [Ignavibacteriota bacterium]